MAVGWNLFKSIAHAANAAVHTFGHIVNDLGPVGRAVAAAFALPAVAGEGAVELLMKAHAGNPAAKQHLKDVVARGGNWPEFMETMAQKLKAHPDFSAFSAHAKVTKAAVHGIIAPPTGGGMPRAQLLARLRAARGGAASHPAFQDAPPGTPMPGDGQEPDDMADSLDDGT
jgi:hypothetical protein